MRHTWRHLSAVVLGVSAVGALVAQETLVPGLTIYPGPVNGAVLERHGKRLAVYGAPMDRAPTPELVLFTHARREVTWLARPLVEGGVGAVVPEQESALFSRPDTFWQEWPEKRFHDYAQQSSRLPVKPVSVERAVKGGDTIAWEGLSIRVLDTPGYTRGAVSYLVELDGKRMAFTGDLIRDDGKLTDLFSFQDAIPAAKIGGYHGWAGRLGDLVVSLQRIAAEKPDLLVPARGPVIRAPAAALNRLLSRVQAVYANYLSIDALRWYFKDEHILAKARRVLGPEVRVNWMPMAETPPRPDWILAIANSRLILAADRSGFLVDCGSPGIVEALKKLRSEGKLASLEHVFVTHYHDDHTDALPLLVQQFGARVHACGSLVDVLEHPGDYRLPCLTRNPITVTAEHRAADSWRWKEFQLTIFDFPGQTLHHNGLLLERAGGGAAFFAGDSFTPSGIDDYCLQNRNFLAEGQGFLRCLDIVEKLPLGCVILNQHVEPPFRFTDAQIERMRATLQRRVQLLATLLPDSDPNFGLDDGWATLHPYGVKVCPGETAHLELRITNHSPRARTFRTRVREPDGFRATWGGPTPVASKAEGKIRIDVRVPADATPGLRVITADVGWEDAELREWAEALLEVSG